MNKISPEYVNSLEQEISRLERKHAGRWRNWVGVTIGSLGLIGLIGANFLIWANRTITDQNRYMAAVSPLIHEPTVQAAITKGATTALFNQVNLNQLVAQALPDRASFLAEPIANQVEAFASKTIGQIVSSDQFATVWDATNRRVQQRVVKVATNGGPTTISVNDLYKGISDRLAGTRLAPLANQDLPGNVGSISLTIPVLTQLPHYIEVLGQIRWLAFGVAIGLLIIGLAVATNRRRYVLGIGWGWVGVALLSLLLGRVARNLLLDRVLDPTYHAAAQTIWQGLTHSFIGQTLILGWAGLVIALVATLLGPARWAVSFRQTSQERLARLRQQWLPTLESNQWREVLHRRHRTLLWIIAGLGLLLVLIFAPLTAGSALAIVIVLTLLLALVEFLTSPVSTSAA